MNIHTVDFQQVLQAFFVACAVGTGWVLSTTLVGKLLQKILG